MLQAIREKVTGWIAYGIIFLISIPFALWGVNSYLGGGEAPPAATVNGEEITINDLDRAYANYRQRLSQLFGGVIPESFGTESILRQQVLDQLVEEYALRQHTEKQRYRIGDVALNQIIRNMQVFKSDGQFSTEIYQNQLRSLGYSPLGFEQELRRNQSIDQFQTGIRATAFVIPLREKQYAELNSQRRKIRSLVYRTDNENIEIGEAAIEQHYQARADRYRTPEQVRIDYIELSLDNVKQTVVINPDDVRARYEENLSLYSSTEFRQASHILLQASDDNSDEVLNRITEVRNRIVNGESFADLARELSEDPVSAAEGGSLGEVERGVMVEAFESALYALQKDQLSEPVKTSFGWHLIRVDDIRGGEVQPFESLQSNLEDEIRTEIAEGQIYDLSENLANLAYEQSDALEPAAEQLDLRIQSSDWFSRSTGDGIAAEAKVRQFAFSPDVLQEGRNSEAFELDGGRILVIRQKQHRPSAIRPLEEVREQIRQELTLSRASEMNREQGALALSELKAGTTLDDLSARWARSISDPGFVGRGQAEIDQAVLQKVFTLPKPEQAAVYDGLSLANGDYVLIELSAVLSSDPDSESSKAEELASATAAAEYQSVLKLLSSRAKIVKTPLDELNY